jgi:hypothetical protein
LGDPVSAVRADDLGIYYQFRRRHLARRRPRAIVLLCAIGLTLFGLVALGEMAVRRWYGGEMPVGGVI